MKQRNDILLAMLIVLMALTAACSHDDAELASEGQAIAFNQQMKDMATASRATTGLETYHQDFKVWGVKTTDTDGDNYTSPQDVMKGYKVEYQANSAGTTLANTSDWDYSLVNGQTPRYWDFSATSYRFFAVSPASAVTTANTTANTVAITFKADATATDITTQPYYSDIWFSNNQGTPKYGDVVNLTFRRPFSQVQFQFLDRDGQPLYYECDNPTDPEADRKYSLYSTKNHESDATPYVQVSKIAFSPYAEDLTIPVTGTITVTYPSAGPSTASLSFAATQQKTGGALAALSLPDTPYTVLPNPNQTKYKMVLTKRSADPDDPESVLTAYVPEEYMQWQPNMKYTYVFKLTQDEMEFIHILQVGITTWQTDTENREHDVYNW